MKLAALAALAALALAPAASAQAPAADRRNVLLVDFVELGRLDRSLPRDMAMVDLVNLTPQVLDIKIGEGSATLEPKDRIIARVAAGDPTVDVMSREPGVPAAGGKLHLESGVRYELALGWGPAPEPEMAPPGVDADPSAPMSPPAPGGAPVAPVAPGGAQVAPGGALIAPKPADPAAAPKNSPAPTKARDRGGKVDIGRKPRR